MGMQKKAGGMLRGTWIKYLTGVGPSAARKEVAAK